MNRLCLIFNLAPHYRSCIYQLIEKNYECHWYFGKFSSCNIKQMNLSEFQDVNFLEEKRFFKGKILYRKGLSSLIANPDYNTFLLTGETHNISVWFFLIKAKLFYRKKHIYVWTHGWYGRESLFERFLKKIFFSMTDGVFLYGNYAKKLMIENNITPSKLFVLHNSLQYPTHIAIRKKLFPTNIYKDHFKNGNYNIIFIGRLTDEKRLDLLIDAIKKLDDEHFPVNLVLIGDGVSKDLLTSRISKYNLTHKVWLYGACYDENENANLIYNADLCVSPGNVGLTAIHCMTFGTPVITHNNYAYQGPEFEAIMPGRTGDFFQQGDLDSMTTVIKNWLNTGKDREAVRQFCYNEIDSLWTPYYQMNVFKEHLHF